MFPCTTLTAFFFYDLCVFSLRAQVVNQIREIVDYKYDGMIRMDAFLTTACFEDHKSQLELITTLLMEAHRMSQLKPGTIQ